MNIVAVDLWVFDLDIPSLERAALEATLSADEIDRANRFVFARDRERYVVGRGRLREILAQRLNGRASQIVFGYGGDGKPSVEGIEFNLSNTGGLAALAVGQVPLGIDIEEIRPLKEDVATRFFSAAEVTQLRALPAEEQLPAFYRCWTRKEAVLKAVGSGLMRALDSFDVTLAPGVPARIERMEGEASPMKDWRLYSFDPRPGFIGAIACRTGGADVAVRRIGA